MPFNEEEESGICRQLIFCFDIDVNFNVPTLIVQEMGNGKPVPKNIIQDERVIDYWEFFSNEPVR